MQTIVVGHRNPDNDSVSSAVAYAYLKNITDPDGNYLPARLGPMPKESAWVFDTYGIEPPMAIPHIHNRVRDAMTPDPICVHLGDTLLDTGRIFREKSLNAIIVLDDEDKFYGVISLRELANLYVAETDVAGFVGHPVTLKNFVGTFDGHIVVGEPSQLVAEHLVILASEPDTAIAAIAPGDTVVLGDRKRTQPLAIEAGAGCVVLSCGAEPTDEIIALAREKGCCLVTSPFDTYTTTRFASLAQSVEHFVDTGVDTCAPDDLLSDVAEFVLAPPYREAAVLDEEGRCVGILTRGDVARAKKPRVILVDHNEMSQAVSGIEEAQVMEIVDHHRVADVQTAAPILFLNFPLGATATIVAQQYQQLGVDIPVPMAAVLLSAIMTDTLLLKSPTCTFQDKMMADTLGAIIGEDPLDFGMKVIKSRGGDLDAPVDDIILADAKEFRIGDNLVMIAQHETVDLESILSREEEIMEAMRRVSENRGFDTFLLLITDVLAEGSQFLCVGKTNIVERAFDKYFDEGSVWMPGVLSRKKQVVGRLIEHGA